MAEAKMSPTAGHAGHLRAEAEPVQEVAAIAVAERWQATAVEGWRMSVGPYDSRAEEAVVAEMPVDCADTEIVAHAADPPAVTIDPVVVEMELGIQNVTLEVPAATEGSPGRPVDIPRASAAGKMTPVAGHGLEEVLEAGVEVGTGAEVADSMIAEDRLTVGVGIAQRLAVFGVELLGEVDKVAPTAVNLASAPKDYAKPETEFPVAGD
ncbi:unnamed protein product [Discula destructiva]